VAPAPTEVVVDGRTLRLSNLDKVLYPLAGTTKGAVIDYYVRVAPALLTHLAGRPLTLKRYPNGVDGQYFYEKRCPKHRPDWVRLAPGEIPFCVVDDLSTLVWVANLASLELHPSLACADDADRPTVLAFDLDPGPPASVLDCARVALELRDLFAVWGLRACVKTSGSKGLQVYVPLNSPTTFEQTKPFARAIAELLERQAPERIVSRMAKELRGGKVLIDWSQNDRHKTTVCVYSLRAREAPTVSTPITWDELEVALETAAPEALVFDADAVIERVGRLGDLFAEVATLEQALPPLVT